MVALETMIEVVASAGITDPILLEQLEALDEAIWDMQFANSQDALAKLAEETLEEYKQGKEETLEEYKQGKTVELDLDELNRKDT